MALYYFHLNDGTTLLDSEGCDLPDLAAVRSAAIATAEEVLGGIAVRLLAALIELVIQRPHPWPLGR
jgi:hypothetical protein